ncbi:MAG TPA: RagB/SusD family nutrient uptake outer membrane protein, partial [Chitinophagaceae bacterium]|nr:RagB/SusD family nutrient uptake outer membrane protein [Chitinophagaceae bacterium]
PGDPTSAYAYNPQLFYKNRGPRFYETIAYNGCTWPINGNKNYRLWTYYVGNTPVETKATSTGFYCRKAIDPNLAVGDVQYAGTDWMEIRFAEVVLNLAESACGINKLGEAYQGLEAIRKRAGIPAGADGLYGLQAGMSRSEMFKAILYERRIEFAFEGKRYWDMRRWKLFEGTLNDSVRTGITIDLDTAAISASDFAAARDTMNLDEAYSKYFTIQSKVLDTKYKIDWQPNYYFFAIPQQSIDNNTKLLQTKGWPGGTFDPLQ